MYNQQRSKHCDQMKELMRKVVRQYHTPFSWFCMRIAMTYFPSLFLLSGYLVMSYNKVQTRRKLIIEVTGGRKKESRCFNDYMEAHTHTYAHNVQ